MRYRKELGVFAAVALVVVGIGMAIAAVAPSSATGGWHRLRLSSTTLSVDSGVGFYTLTGAGSSDSIVNNAIYFSQGVIQDTNLAVAGGSGAGTPKVLSGGVTNGVGTFYIQMSDTARATAGVTYSSATEGSGTWSSTFTNNSGADSNIFITSAEFSSVTRTFVGDTINGALTIWPLSASLGLASSGDSFTWPNRTDTVIAIRLGDTTVGDTVRIIVVNPAGRVSFDSAMNAAAAPGDTVFVSSAISFETGVSKIIILIWDASQAKYAVKIGTVRVGAAANVNSITTADMTAEATLNIGTGNVVVTLTVPSQTPAIGEVQMLDVAGDGAAKSDNFAQIDTNTSGFDTRLQNTVFQILVTDASGAPIKVLESGKTALLVIPYNFSLLTSSQASAVRLLHLDDATNSWEVVSNSTSDSTNGRLVAYVSEFSHFAMGNVSSGAAAAPADDDNCVIQNTIGHTSLAGLMPSLRGVRDTMMGNAIGRLFVSGYYGFAAFAMILFAAAGAGFAFSKRG
jgi:hypothetical protein